MKYKIVKNYDISKSIEVKLLTYLWCNDGWCYIPELKKRQVYWYNKDQDYYTIESVEWEGVIPMVEHHENIKMMVYSHSPRVWSEETEDFFEIYEEQTTN